MATTLEFCSFSPIQLFATPGTVAVRLLGQWSFPGKNAGGDLPDSGIETDSPASLALQVEKTREALRS